MKMMSDPALIGASRLTSLSRRFTLFLITALPILLPTANANRLVSKPLGTIFNTNSPLAHPRPSWYIKEKRFLPLRRCPLRIQTRPGLNRQLVAALEPAPPQYGPPSRGARSFPEAVDALAAALFGLIRTFGHDNLPVGIIIHVREKCQFEGRRLVAGKSSRKRADLLLVERGLVESRERAQALIMEGLVYSPSGRVLKPGSPISTTLPLEVKSGLPYVGRGGIKLSHALDRFGLDVSSASALDVGASTGGFTDCLLQRGARRVVALDVGRGQLDYRLRQDPRVVVMEGVNARYPFSLPPSARLEHPTSGSSDAVELSRSGSSQRTMDLATIDVSFISATKVMPSVAAHVKEGGYIVVLAKPQFEARREEVGRRGVIRDPGVHARVLGRVIFWAVEEGFRLRNLTASPILGDAGNREFFLLLQR